MSGIAFIIAVIGVFLPSVSLVASFLLFLKGEIIGALFFLFWAWLWR